MTGKNRRHYHCKALNSLLCADVPLRNYSLTTVDVETVKLTADIFLVIGYAASLTAILILFDIVCLNTISPAACVNDITYLSLRVSMSIFL